MLTDFHYYKSAKYKALTDKGAFKFTYSAPIQNYTKSERNFWQYQIL